MIIHPIDENMIVFLVKEYNVRLEYNFEHKHICLSNIDSAIDPPPFFFKKKLIFISAEDMKMRFPVLARKFQKSPKHAMLVEFIFCEIMKAAGLLRYQFEKTGIRYSVISAMMHDIYLAEFLQNNYTYNKFQHLDEFFNENN